MVIAIIAILMAMLLPALKQARDMAKKSICVSQLRQVIRAVPTYSDDYGGWMPPHNQRHPDTPATVYWADYLCPYFDPSAKISSLAGGGRSVGAMSIHGHIEEYDGATMDMKRSRLLDCPSVDAAKRLGAAASRYEYTWNVFHSWVTTTPANAVKTSFFRRPDLFAQIIDNGYQGDPAASWAGDPERTFNPAVAAQMTDLATSAPHLRSVNAGYLDGHVDTLSRQFLNSYVATVYVPVGWPFRQK